MSVTSGKGAIEAQSAAGVNPPASMCHVECARSGGSPEGARSRQAHGVAADSWRGVNHAASPASGPAAAAIAPLTRIFCSQALVLADIRSDVQRRMTSECALFEVRVRPTAVMDHSATQRLLTAPLRTFALSESGIIPHRGARYGAPAFHLQKHAGSDTRSGADGACVTKAQCKKRRSHLHCHLVQAQEARPLVVQGDELHRKFACVHRADYPAVIRRAAAGPLGFSRLIPRSLRCFVTLSESLVIRTRGFTR